MFSRKYYLENNADVAAAFADPLEHYLKSGWRESRRSHPLFNPNFYRSKYGLTEEEDPLEHYLTKGVGLGYQPREISIPDTTTKKLPRSRRVVDLLDDSWPINFPDQKVRIGAFLHIYYADLAQSIVHFANNIPAPCTLYITTTTSLDAHQIERVCKESSIHPFEIRIVPNRGRDICPMIVGFRDASEKCDVAVHLHTKKSKHYGTEFSVWREYLYHENVGSKQIVAAILSLLSRPEVGAVAPDHFANIHQLIQWGGNFKILKELLKLSGELLSEQHFLDFPSGSMFWFKTKALQSILDLHLQLYHFEPEAGQIDGTLAHVIERGFFYFIETAGYEWLISKSGSANESDKSPIAGLPFRSGNRIFPTSNDLGQYKKYYPECTRFLARASDISRPRLNLLIPMVDLSKGYAGVSTALDLFYRLADACASRFDTRIIITDVSPQKTYVAREGFVIEEQMDQDRVNCRSVIDGAQRYRFPILLRDQDFFFATAWWTAQNAIHLQKQQDRIFGEKARRFMYFIQDFEPGFYGWSTKYALAENTYKYPSETIPIFNTGLLRDFFIENNYFSDGLALFPGINPAINKNIIRETPKQAIVLLYARPHADRNCLAFIDMVIAEATSRDQDFWEDWRFIAIGEDMSPQQMRCSTRIEIRGRLLSLNTESLHRRQRLVCRSWSHLIQAILLWSLPRPE